MFCCLCDWLWMQRVFWLRFPYGKLDTLICLGIYRLETHRVFKSITRWTVLLNSHKHVTVHNSSKTTTCSHPSLCACKYCLQCFSVSVALGFLHHWKMLWIKWWPGWMGKSNFQLLPGKPPALVAYKTPDRWNCMQKCIGLFTIFIIMLIWEAPGWPARFGFVWYNIRKRD